MVERRAEVVGRLKALEEGAAPLIAFLQNPNAYQELRADKQYNLQMLNDRYQVEFRLYFQTSLSSFSEDYSVSNVVINLFVRRKA